VPIVPPKQLHCKSNQVAEIIIHFFFVGVSCLADQMPYPAFHMATQAPTPTQRRWSGQVSWGGRKGGGISRSVTDL